MSNTIETMRGMLTPLTAYWTLLVESLPDEIIQRPAAPGEWSALQCLYHLLDNERLVFSVRMRLFLSGGDAFPAFNPDEEGTDYSQMSPAEVAREFARHRSENLQLLEQVQPQHMALEARHSELGMVTLEQLLNEWVAHDLNHTIQAERALMQAFIPGCGPWRPYFKEHDLDGR
ncbi:MAG: DinB family protein [Chloroflexia bacterium]